MKTNDKLSMDSDPLIPTRPLISTRPPMPQDMERGLGLVGCGGITKHHLEAYRKAGWKVLALCDLDIGRARQRKLDFYPEADLYEDYRELLKDDRIEIVDVATHPEERSAILRDSLLAGKHVLSQKPFVIDLDEGEELCELAERCGRKLAINQNGRYAPHFYYARQAIAKGMIGTPFASHLSVHWDHSWVAGTPFDQIKHLVLFDFAIHWFDMIRCLMPGMDPVRVFASTAKGPSQSIRPNGLAQVLVEWESGQSSLAFDAIVPFGHHDRMLVAGTTGTISSNGPDYNQQVVTLSNAEGNFQPRMEGAWFSDGFGGTMAELMLSIEENRPCELDARENLKSLALCFAAIASAELGRSCCPFEIRRLPD